jgi:hypothetical protein
MPWNFIHPCIFDWVGDHITWLLRQSSLWKKLRLSSFFKNIEVVFCFSSSWIEIGLLTKNQLPIIGCLYNKSCFKLFWVVGWVVAIKSLNWYKCDVFLPDKVCAKEGHILGFLYWTRYPLPTSWTLHDFSLFRTLTSLLYFVTIVILGLQIFVFLFS